MSMHACKCMYIADDSILSVQQKNKQEAHGRVSTDNKYCRGFLFLAFDILL